MKELFIDCEQGSKQWFDCRLGAVTSSRIADVVAKRKRGTDELACRADMRWELAIELLTGKPTEHYVSRWMKEGKEKEPDARQDYENRFCDGFVEQVGFAYHPTIKLAGASPDGVIGARGLLEIKCPRIETHLQYLIDDKIPDDYLPQMVWQLACVPDAEWNDFVSYHPDLDEDYRLFVKRLERTTEVEALILAYALEVEQFNSEVQLLLGKIREKRQVALQV